MAGLKQAHHPQLVGDGTTKGFATTNAHVKPKAREVLAALNDGRQLHGSNTTDGFSHLILNPNLKKRALYYPPDMLVLASQGVGSQCSDNTHGSVLKGAHPHTIVKNATAWSGRNAARLVFSGS